MFDNINEYIEKKGPKVFFSLFVFDFILFAVAETSCIIEGYIFFLIYTNIKNY